MIKCYDLFRGTLYLHTHFTIILIPLSRLE
jgi:hypothetical protein